MSKEKLNRKQTVSQEALAEKNARNYYKKMKHNKYWRRGYKAAEAGKEKDSIPYKLSEKIRKLLKKRTFWIMGFEEYDLTAGKVKRSKEIASEERRAKKDLKRQERKLERLRERRRHKDEKRKKKHKRKHR